MREFEKIKVLAGQTVQDALTKYEHIRPRYTGDWWPEDIRIIVKLPNSPTGCQTIELELDPKKYPMTPEEIAISVAALVLGAWEDMHKQAKPK